MFINHPFQEGEALVDDTLSTTKAETLSTDEMMETHVPRAALVESIKTQISNRRSKFRQECPANAAAVDAAMLENSRLLEDPSLVTFPLQIIATLLFWLGCSMNELELSPCRVMFFSRACKVLT